MLLWNLCKFLNFKVSACSLHETELLTHIISLRLIITCTIAKPVVQHLPSDLSFMALPSENTSSKQAMITLADWLSDCSSKHEFCSSAVAHTTSCRILRLTNTHVYLEEGSDRKLHYACLSHCWGPLGPALQLTYSTEGNFRKGLAITDLPKTFSDAVRVSLNVGIQFLWIDALCKCAL